MDLKKWGSEISERVKKYRYGVLILALGILLMVLPIGKKTTQSAATPKETVSTKQDITQELTQMLSAIDGVGKVKVMLSIACGEQIIYQTDQDQSGTENSTTIRTETVIITDADRQQQALISLIKPPQYKGAIIVCQGADHAAVRLAVVEAVMKITGLRSDQIAVVKMK